MKGTIVIRIYAGTYMKLRKNFKAQRGESAASYFERLSKKVEQDQRYIEEQNIQW